MNKELTLIKELLDAVQYCDVGNMSASEFKVKIINHIKDNMRLALERGMKVYGT